MEYKNIIVTSENSVGKILLNRPKAMNSLSMEMRDELEDSLSRLDLDDGISLIMITGGPKTFSAGFDLKEAVETNLKSFFHHIVEYHETIYTVKKFVITAVTGFTLAGGFDLALAGDMILASDRASFGHVEVNFGINPLLFPLYKKVGATQAQELCATGKIIDAVQAKEMGIVNEIHPHENFVAIAEKRAGEIAQIGAGTLSAIKESASHILGIDVLEALNFEFALTSKLVENSNFQDKITTFLKTSGMSK